MEIQAKTELHAHRCKVCLKNGKQVLWIHGDECAGNVEAHKCSVCGNAEFEKHLIPVHQARAIAQKQIIVDFGQILIYVCLISLAIVYFFDAVQAVQEYVKSRNGVTPKAAKKTK